MSEHEYPSKIRSLERITVGGKGYGSFREKHLSDLRRHLREAMRSGDQDRVDHAMEELQAYYHLLYSVDMRHIQNASKEDFRHIESILKKESAG